jgi:hypothetical protein
VEDEDDDDTIFFVSSDFLLDSNLLTFFLDLCICTYIYANNIYASTYLGDLSLSLSVEDEDEEDEDDDIFFVSSDFLLDSI